MKTIYLDLFHTNSIVSWANVKSVYKTSLKNHILDFHFFLGVLKGKLVMTVIQEIFLQLFLNSASS